MRGFLLYKMKFSALGKIKMSNARKTMRMPELLVFARSFVMGLMMAEVFRLGYYGGHGFAPLLAGFDLRLRAFGILFCVGICLAYAISREAYANTMRVVRSMRADLLVIAVLGLYSNILASHWLDQFHKSVINLDPHWVPIFLCIALLILSSSLWRAYWPKKKSESTQLYFLTDEEIKSSQEDILGNAQQAISFADTVMASGAHSGLVFGIDGPWGTGKTSFINLAERHWRDVGHDSFIVFRFEPLRYASDPNLSERFIRELSTTIQRSVFVPEFRPAASRYSRMLKGKADFSFLGFKFSLEPSSETMDDLLEDIDDVLKHIQRRIIIVVDDLDRLEAKTVNSVLFTVRRTFKLSNATYILCYDTENLVLGREEGLRAREFLEKFVNVKFSLFVDSSMLRDFLLIDWRSEENRFASIPADTMLKLSSLLSELANLLGGAKAAKYAPLVGDLRKVKRFVNAVLMMQIEKTDLARTDFDRRDLINLMLLHLTYPGIFRQIYSQECEGRSGVFSIKSQYKNSRREFYNDEGFESIVGKCEPTERFLLEQLFDVTEVGLDSNSSVSEELLRSRACFNDQYYRNLEKYLKLIVRFAVPEPQDTFRLYQDAVRRIKKNGTKISIVLNEPEFNLQNGDSAHEQFWRLLVSESFDLAQSVADDAINTLIEYLPRYSSVHAGDRGLRQLSIYSLILLLDRAGWGREGGKRKSNTRENVIEIAYRIFGEAAYKEKGLIERLAPVERGVLGWYDLMLFRLQCSADRQGQVYNIQTALVVYENAEAKTDGLVSEVAVREMRVLSQRIFARFKEVFIVPRRNYLAAVDLTSDADFYGDAPIVVKEGAGLLEPQGGLTAEGLMLASRSGVKSFVVYQLINRLPPTGAGVGCGYYDEVGVGDSGGIAVAMNAYLFDVCFNLEADKENARHFVDFFLGRLTNSFWSGGDEGPGYIATVNGLVGELDVERLKNYWSRFGQQIKDLNLSDEKRLLVTVNYITTYAEDLPKVFAILDGLIES